MSKSQAEGIVHSCGPAEVVTINSHPENIALIPRSERTIFGFTNYIHDLQMLTREQSSYITNMTTVSGSRGESHVEITGFGTAIFLFKTTNGQTKVSSLLVWYAPGYANVLGQQYTRLGYFYGTYQCDPVLWGGTEWLNVQSQMVKLKCLDDVIYIPYHYVVRSQQISEEPEADPYQLCNVYCDGACWNNHHQYGRVAGAGVFFNDEDPRNRAIRITNCDYPTNQIAELVAVRETLEAIILSDLGKSESKYRVFTDSNYAIKCVTEWYKKWQDNGWKNSRNQRVKNSEIIQTCLEYIDVINTHYASKRWGKLQFVHVKGHSDNYGNEMADDLANDGCADDQDDDGRDVLYIEV